MALRVLLVDNFDSYTFNLYQRLAAVSLPAVPAASASSSSGDVSDSHEVTVAATEPEDVPVEVHVVRNSALVVGSTDDGASSECGGAERSGSRLGWVWSDYDCVVISPGPGLPSREADFGQCAELIRGCGSADVPDLPLLGVCLGHQGIVEAFGGSVVHAPEVAHGVLSPMHHDGTDPLFRNIPDSFDAVRYHSWLGVLPEAEGDGGSLDLIPIATTEEAGQLLTMAVRHTSKPIWGVQFHPESVCTQHGDTILRNFLLEVLARRPLNVGSAPDGNRVPTLPTRLQSSSNPHLAHNVLPPQHQHSDTPAVQLLFDFVDTASLGTIENAADGVDIGATLHTALVQDKRHSFWLDSSKVSAEGVPGGEYSFLGWVDRDGSDGEAGLGVGTSPRSKVVQYDSESRALSVIRVVDGEDGHEEVDESTTVLHDEYPTLFDWLQAEMDTRFLSPATRANLWTRRINRSTEGECDASDGDGDDDAVFPFPFAGGFVGYLGYEMRRECGSTCTVQSQQPDASFVYTERFLAVDHKRHRVYAAAMCTLDDGGASAAGATAWVHATLADATGALRDFPRQRADDLTKDHPSAEASPENIGDFTLRHDYQGYTDNIRECLDEINAGESYELCLTNQMTATIPASAAPPPILYNYMRQLNPAPYGALLRFGDLWVLQGSPECFLRVSRDGKVQAKPIKGTAPRGGTKEEDERLRHELATSPKDFSENLMILDLIRNDIGQVCEVGSVTAPRIMQIESFATVHQLVSTVEGQLRPDIRAAHLLQHAFPPGSMTGAPKLRSMEILERLEVGPRGVYSGSLGFMSLDGGCDMSVVIRTVLLDTAKQTWSIGCGGAIVNRSEPTNEFHEMLLKAKAPLRASAAAFFGREMLSPSTEIPVHGILGCMGDEASGVVIPQSAMTGGISQGRDNGGAGRKMSIQGEIYAGAAEQSVEDDRAVAEVSSSHSCTDSGSFAAVAAVKALASEKLLGGLGARGISLGLDRIQSVLHQLNDPQNAVGGVVHVTGTNGKGSVSCFVEAALRGAAIAGAGGQVGLFTSPHLVRFTECIKVDGEDIPDADLVNLATVALQACREVGTELTQFEVLTVAAFLYFKRRGVGAVVLEVGLGGRLDSTNVVPAHLTLCSVVTSISLDHTNILGSTLAAIAREKSGIFRRGRPVVLGANIPHEAREVLLATAASLDCPVVTAGRAELDASGASCSYRELAKVSMPLRGDHQLVNLATAADVLLSPLVLEHVAQTSAPTAFAQGISSLVRWPARLQPLVYQQRLVLLDGSHNEAAGSVLSDFVSAEAKRLSVGWWPMDGGVGGVCGSDSLHAVGVPVHWIVGMLVGKKHAAYLQTILCADRGDTLTCVPVHPNVSWHSGAPPDVLAAAVPLTVIPSARIRVCATVEEAVASTTSVTAANQTLVVVCGSLHLCGQVLAHAEATSVKGVAPMELLETLRYCVGPLGILLMTEHLARLRDAAARFGFPFSEEVFRAHVAHAIDTSDGASDLRIRCTLAYDGAISISATALAHDAPVPCLDIPSINEMRGSDRTVSVSVRKSSAINALNPMLSYKTTWRQVYRDAMAQRPSAAATSDVLLVNSCDEVTEATIYNVMILCPDTDRWVTPPVACGLLPGVLRAHLLTSKKIVEGIVTLSALRRATAVCVMNSVRGVLPARVVWDDGV